MSPARLAAGPRVAAVLLAVLVAGFFAPMVVRREVVFPDDNARAVGEPSRDPEAAGAPRRGDLVNYYLPELEHHLHENRRAWLSTWNPHVELGRPASHITGLSRAYVLTRLLAVVFRDALVLYTALALLAVAVTAAFAYLFLLQVLRLHPMACLSAAAGLALGSFVIARLFAPMFVFGVGWTLCLLWAAGRHLERPTLARGLAISFAVHSLFMTAHPQLVVWQAYLVLAFLAWRWWSARPASGRAAVWPLAGVFVWGGLGLLTAAPVYLDLMIATARSDRPETDVEFFLRSLDPIRSPRDALVLLTGLFDDRWATGTLRRLSRRPSLTPVFLSLIAASLLDPGWRRTGLWIAFAGACVLLAVIPVFFEVGFEWLGLSLARKSPLLAAQIPLFVCAGIGLDLALRGTRTRRALLTAASAPLLASAAGLATAGHAGGAAQVWPALAVWAGLAAVLWTRAGLAVPLLVAATAFLYSAPILISWPRAGIRLTSPLVEAVRRETAAGSRYAIVGRSHIGLLHANQEAFFGLRGIHSVNPLLPRQYVSWAETLTGGRARFPSVVPSRRFTRVPSFSGLDLDEASRAGVGLLVSTVPPPAELGAEAWGPGLWRKRLRPLLEAQLEARPSDDGRVDVALPAEPSPRFAVAREVSLDDHLVFRVSPHEEPTVLFVSQQYHPSWRARAEGRDIRTLVVNGFYQGVLVPSHTQRVILDFEPAAVWAWAAHCLFAAGFTSLLALRAKRSLIARRGRRGRFN